MRDFEQSHSEINRGKISSKTRAEISHIQSSTLESRKREEEKKRANYSNYGTNKYTMVGATDRLLGRWSFPELEKKLNFSEGDKISYFYGYNKRGNRNLEIYCIGKVPDYIDKQELLVAAGLDKEVTEENIRLAIETMLTKIGYIDGQNPFFEYDKLPQPIKDNPSYAQGYLMASIMGESKGKSRR